MRQSKGFWGSFIAKWKYTQEGCGVVSSVLDSSFYGQTLMGGEIINELNQRIGMEFQEWICFLPE
jgi:hypothetical protein